MCGIDSFRFFEKTLIWFGSDIILIYYLGNSRVVNLEQITVTVDDTTSTSLTTTSE